MDDLLEPLATALRRSPFVLAMRLVRSDNGLSLALGRSPLRSLIADEVATLRTSGNTADDWDRVLVADGFRPEFVQHSHFQGDVVLGRFGGFLHEIDGAHLPSGVYRSTVVDSIVGHDAAVRDVSLLARYVIGRQATVIGCGRVVCDGSTTFGNGVTIPIGPETGGRLLKPFAEITLPLADAVTTPSIEQLDPRRYAATLAEYLREIESERGVIAARAFVAHVAVVRNSYVGEGARLDSVARIDTCTLLSDTDEPVRVRDGACITESLLQRGVSVAGPAVIEHSVLLEHSAVERFGKVVASVLGSNTSVGGGEVTSCLVGPFVACHHQSLLIAVRWPAGRGNIGYGAGVGCNHTSRAPDQEAVLGEGIFVGLGARLQYPVDLSDSPYSVLACGVAMPPQRVAFPFSLIRPASESIPGVAPGMNVITPAWMLSENLYAVERCIQKFRNRDRVARHRSCHEIFRPAIFDLMADACVRLEAVPCCKEVYNDRDIPGLGRNVLLERHRVAAIRCYREHLERRALLELFDRLECLHSEPTEETQARLTRLKTLLDDYGRAVEESKARDEARGPTIIADYAEAHPPTRDDPVVRAVWEAIRDLQARIESVVGEFAIRNVSMARGSEDQGHRLSIGFSGI